MLRLVAALVAAVLLTAQAQTPTPTARPSQPAPQQTGVKATPQQQPVAAASQTQAATPQTVVISVSDNAKSGQNSSKPVPKPERDAFDYVDLGSAILIGLGTFLVFVWQTRLLTKTNEISERNAVIAERQMKLAGAQTDILEKQKEIQRQEFLATHRPVLEVRFVRQVADGVEITVINTGTAAADFVAARAEIRHIAVGEALPSSHDIAPEADFTLRSRFEPSDSDRYVIPPNTNPAAAFDLGFGGPTHVFGWIVYTTSDTPKPVSRITYFGRRVESLMPELVHIEGTDWNFIQ